MASLPHVPTLATPSASEPADKWASSTLDAVSEEQKRVHETQSEVPHSTVSTPGVSFPGAFPGKPAGASAVQADVGYVRDAAYSALETAKGYVGSAGQTVAGYIPERLTTILPESLSPTSSKMRKSTSEETPSATGLECLSGESLAKLPEERREEGLPSHDDNAPALGKTAGVGSLPGHASEEGVAILPEERGKPSYLNPVYTVEGSNNAEPTSSAKAATLPEDPRYQKSAQASVVSTLDGADTDASTRTLHSTNPEDNKANAVAPTPPPKAAKSELETLREHFDATPRSAKPTDVIVTSAKKHEREGEAKHKDKPAPTTSRSAGEHSEQDLKNTSPNKPLNLAPRTHPLASEPATFNSIPLDEAHQRDLDNNQEKQLSLGEASHGKLAGASVPEDEKGTKLNINSPRAEGPVVPEKIATRHTDATTTGRTGGGAGIAAPETSKHDRQGSASSATKKAGFMSKFKGEMKVLSGKLAHNEEKIDEGRKMMGKN